MVASTATDRRKDDPRIITLQESMDALRREIIGVTREVGEAKSGQSVLVEYVRDLLKILKETSLESAKVAANLDTLVDKVNVHGDRMGKVLDWMAAHVEEHKHTTFDKSMNNWFGGNIGQLIWIILAAIAGGLGTRILERIF